MHVKSKRYTKQIDTIFLLLFFLHLKNNKLLSPKEPNMFPLALTPFCYSFNISFLSNLFIEWIFCFLENNGQIISTDSK